MAMSYNTGFERSLCKVDTHDQYTRRIRRWETYTTHLLGSDHSRVVSDDIAPSVQDNCIEIHRYSHVVRHKFI